MDVSGVVAQSARRAAGLAADAGAGLVHRLQNTRIPGVGTASAEDDEQTAARRWRAVTVLRAPDEVGTPPPLAALGNRLELRVSKAPGERGSELAARFRDRPTEDDLGRLRSALREAKQLLEAGEVLRLEPQPHGPRPHTPLGGVLDGMTRRAPEEGVL